MKSLKKYLVGLGAILVLGLLFVAAPKPAAAAGAAQYNEEAKCFQTLKFKDYAHVTCQLSSSRTITFTASNPTTTDGVGAGNYNFAPPADVFCGPDSDFDGNGTSQGLNVYWDHGGNGDNKWHVGNFNEGFAKVGDTSCNSFDIAYSNSTGYYPINGLVGNGNRTGTILAGTTDGTGAQSLDGVTDGSLAGQTFSRWQAKYDPTAAKGADKFYLFAENITLPAAGTECSGSILAVAADKNDSSKYAYEYTLSTGGDPLSKYPQLNTLSKLPNMDNCYVSNTNFGADGLTHPTAQIYISPAIKNLSKIAEGNGANSGNSDASNNPNTSACVSSDVGKAFDTTLEWLLCPVIDGISKSADAINSFVEGQLNFSVSDNLTNDVQRAWTVFKDLVSAILVIFMLIMVIAQAIGGGSFLEAYTIKKLLPRLVIAIIFMQLSWAFCTYSIQLANDAGTGIATLMQAPFGGGGNLDLPSLLSHLHAVAGLTIAGVTTATAISAIVASGAVIFYGWPVLLLAVILVFISLVVALATLLVRNALIIILVMLSPLAFLAWVLPGTQEYWKKWKTNFTKLLVFFPLVMAMIWGGRIFAWVAGGLGRSGPLDLIMVLIGFFLPYFYLPKTFKWGGDLLSGASKMISDNGLVKAGRSTANKYLGFKDEHGAGYRKQQALVDKKYSHLTPADKEGVDLSKMSARQRLAWRASRGADGKGRWRHYAQNAAIRTLAGSPIPTTRATAVMDKKAGEWKKNEIGLLAGRINNDYKEFQKRPGWSVQMAKEAVRDKWWNNSKEGSLGRRAFLTWGRDTKSFLEMGQAQWRMGGHNVDGVWVPPTIRQWNSTTKTGVDQNGNTVNEADLARHWNPDADMAKSQDWIDWQHGDSDAYGDISRSLPGFVPYRTAGGGGPNPKDPKMLALAGNDPLLAHGLADSKRFFKAIDQAEDPASVVGWRAEHYEELAEITKSLKAAKLPTEGADRLKLYIEEQSKTLAGRNILQRLSGYSENHINAMFDPGNTIPGGYLQSKLMDPRAQGQQQGQQRPTPAASGGSGNTWVPRSGTNTVSSPPPPPPTPPPAPSSGPTPPPAPSSGPTPPSSTTPGSVIAPTKSNSSTTPGIINLQAGYGDQPRQPIELRIDHDALAETIRTAAKQGIKQGLREHGAPIKPGTLPGEIEGSRDIFPEEKE